MHRQSGTWLMALLVALATLAVVSCSDKPNQDQPPAVEYRLYYSYVEPDNSILGIDIATGEVLDSTPKFGGPNARLALIFSEDGRYAYYSLQSDSARRTWIEDRQSGDTVALIEGVSGPRLELSPDGSTLLLEWNGITILSLPSLTVVHQDANAIEGALHPTLPRCYYGAAEKDSFLHIVDYGAIPPQITKRVLRDKLDREVYPTHLVVSGDGSRLILNDIASNTSVIIYSTSTLEREAELRFRDGGWRYDGLILHPNGKTVFAKWYGDPFLTEPGLIDQIDLDSLSIRPFLSILDLNGQPRFMPSMVAIHPSGTEVYILDVFWQSGAVYRIDFDGRAVSELLSREKGIPTSISLFQRKSN